MAPELRRRERGPFQPLKALSSRSEVRGRLTYYFLFVEFCVQNEKSGFILPMFSNHINLYG
jgi:hypothetical protein